MADTEKNVWVNTLLDKEQAEKLDAMVVQNGSDRAKFIRWLIEKEWEDRQHIKNGAKNFYKVLNNRAHSTRTAAPTK